MTADEAAEAIRLRFNCLSLPSLRDEKTENYKEETDSSSDVYTDDDETYYLETKMQGGREAWRNENKISNSALMFKNSAVLWQTRTTQPASGQMLLPTHNCGVLYNDEGIPIIAPLDTTVMCR